MRQTGVSPTVSERVGAGARAGARALPGLVERVRAQLSERSGRGTSADAILADSDLEGRVALVTGASAGIGLETARALAARGAEVLLGCRTRFGAEHAAAAIRARHPQAHVKPLQLDLASFASIHSSVAALEPGPLHMLICNAGVYVPHFEPTEDGLERIVGVCHFGHFLLVDALLARLRASAPARVVVVSSESHRRAYDLDFTRFPQTSAQFRAPLAYAQAKLCNVLFAAELDRRSRRDGVSAYALHPGSLISTSIGRSSLAARLALGVARPFSKTVAQGAATSVYCAVARELTGRGGRYFVDCRERLPSPSARDERAARRLWELSAARVGKSAQQAQLGSR